MKILWLSHIVPYPPKAGVLLRAYYLLRSLAQGNELHLVSFVQESMLRSLYSDVSAGLEECRAALERECASVTLLPIDSLRQPLGRVGAGLRTLLTGDGYMADWLASRNAEQTIAALVQAHRPDIAHLDSVTVARYRPILGSMPATLGHHNVESHMLQRRADNESNVLKRAYFARESRRLRAFERRVVPEFALNLMCSELDAERLRAIVPGARTAVVPNGVDCDFFQPTGVVNRPDSLIFVGTMSWYPNVSAALFLLREIWPLLSRMRPAATLDLVGAGAPQELRELAAASAGVTLHGFVPEIRPLIESASVYICPIRDGGGTKLKILDACAMASCILAHPIACEGIDVSDGVDVVFAEEPQQFADLAVALLDDSQRRRRLGVAARRLVEERYSFAGIGREFAALMRETAGLAATPATALSQLD